MKNIFKSKKSTPGSTDVSSASSSKGNMVTAYPTGLFSSLTLKFCIFLGKILGSDIPASRSLNEEVPAIDEKDIRSTIPMGNYTPSPKKESYPLYFAAILSTIGLSASTSAYAQDAVGFINETHSQIISIGSVLYQVVVAIMGIIALVSLITLAIRIQNSDREGASKATGWFAIMIFCIVMCVVIKNYMGF